MSVPVSSRVLSTAAGVLAGSLLALAAPTLVLAAPEGTSFEAIARTAEPAPDSDALTAAFTDDCSRARREIDRARCRGMQSFVGDRLSQRLYVTTVDSANAVAVSSYDVTVKGFRMRVVGCLTCEEPVQGAAPGKRFLTLKSPGRDADSMGAGVTLARPTLPFDNLNEAKAWETEVKPNLRAEFVFRPVGKEWSYKDNKGLAFEPVALRVFDRCTGHVVYSEPPSEGRAAVEEGACAPANAQNVALLGREGGRNKEEMDDLPEKLGALQIGEAIKEIRSDLGACDSQYRRPGTVELEFEVAGSGGNAQAVRARGQLAGTDVAQCLMSAAHKVQFPRFQQGKQVFKYSVRLDGK